jgi:hypothetical protein
MADLKSGLKKKRKKRSEYHDVIASGPEDYGYTPADTGDLDKEYEAYKMERDTLGSEERKESRAARKRARMIKALGQAADAIGKIGASKAGGLVEGDLVPDLEVGQGDLDAIGEKYDTKRLSLSKKGRELQSKGEALAESDKAAKAEAIAKRKVELARIRKEQDVQAEEEKIAKLEKADQEKAFKYRSKARKDVDKMTDKLIEGIEEEEMQGEDVIEVLENEGVPEEVIAPFRETLGFMEDEEAQVETLEDLKSKLIVHTVRKRVEQDIADGKPVNPRIREALGLTEAPKDDTIETSKPEAKASAPTGEPARIRYELILPNGAKQIISKTPEEAEDIRDNAESKGLNIKLKRLK